MMPPDEAGQAPPRGPDLALPLRVVVGVAFITIVVLTLAQIFFRFVLDAPLIWSEELVRLLIVWVTFIGAAVVAYDGRHLNVDVAFQLFPPGLKRVVRWINLAVALAFLAALAWFSLRLIRIEGMTDMGALPLSYAWIRLPALVGGVLIVAYLLLRRFTGRGDPDRDAL
jgi:TRAP-type C4-dicarboxylate transport system permease small subunit